MKHTSLYQDAERWTKNAARTVWKSMTYDNALKALTVATAVPVIASSAGVVGAGVAAGSGLQVVQGLASGLSAAASLAPDLRPPARVARNASYVATAVSDGAERTAARRRAQGPMTGQSYLNEYGIRYANPNDPSLGTPAQTAYNLRNR